MDEGIFIEKGESVEEDEAESRTATDEIGGEVIYFIIFFYFCCCFPRNIFALLFFCFSIERYIYFCVGKMLLCEKQHVMKML